MKKSLFKELQKATWLNAEPSYEMVKSFKTISKEILKMCFPECDTQKIVFDVCDIRYVLCKNKDDTVDITISNDVNVQKEKVLIDIIDENSVINLLERDISDCKFRMNTSSVTMLEEYKETMSLESLKSIFDELDESSDYNYKRNVIGTEVLSKSIDLMNFMTELNYYIGDKDYNSLMEIITDDLEESLENEKFENNISTLDCTSGQDRRVDVEICKFGHMCTKMSITTYISDRKYMEYHDTYNNSEVRAIIGVFERRLGDGRK